jgi:hypothetical protein
VNLSTIGKVAKAFFEEITDHFKGVVLDALLKIL